MSVREHPSCNFSSWRERPGKGLSATANDDMKVGRLRSMKTRQNTESSGIDMGIPATSWVRMAVVAVGRSEVRAESAKVGRTQCVAWTM
jgi:hypothetical protein